MKSYFPGIEANESQRLDGISPLAARWPACHWPQSHRSNAFYAFGHGHVGLTQAAITGRLIAQSFCGRELIWTCGRSASQGFAKAISRDTCHKVCGAMRISRTFREKIAPLVFIARSRSC